MSHGYKTRIAALEAENAELRIRMAHFEQKNELLRLFSKNFPTLDETGLRALALAHEERQRQIHMERNSPEHDECHTKNELVWAAMFYAMPVDVLMSKTKENPNTICITPDDFFYQTGWYNFKNKRDGKSQIRRNVIAAALLLADVERILRAGMVEMSENLPGVEKYDPDRICPECGRMGVKFVLYPRKELESKVKVACGCMCGNGDYSIFPKSAIAVSSGKQASTEDFFDSVYHVWKISVNRRREEEAQKTGGDGNDHE